MKKCYEKLKISACIFEKKFHHFNTNQIPSSVGQKKLAQNRKNQ